MSVHKDAVHKDFRISKEAFEQLKFCMGRRGFKTHRAYFEQLISEDFNRLQSGSTGTDLTPVMNLLNVIGSHITSSLQYSVLTKKILGRLFILLLSQEHLSPDAKQSKSDALKNFEKIIEAASKEFSESFGG